MNRVRSCNCYILNNILLIVIIFQYYTEHSGTVAAKRPIGRTLKQLQHLNEIRNNLTMEVTDSNMFNKYFVRNSSKNVKTFTTEAYDNYCYSFHKCYECVKARKHSCFWHHNFGCTTKFIRNDFKPSIKANPIKVTKDYKVCSYIEHPGPIFVPADVRTTLEVLLQVGDAAVLDHEIYCQVTNIDTVFVKATILDGKKVICNSLVLRTRDLKKPDKGVLKLKWGGVELFSNEIYLIIYKCEFLGTSRKMCSLLPKEYKCYWNEEKKSCVLKINQSILGFRV